MEKDNIGLFDMDGTLCDYDGAIKRDYDLTKSPNDPPYSHDNKKYPHLKARVDFIRRVPGWWLSLKKFQLGWDILRISDLIGFEPHILTQGPRACPNAWSEKLQWIQNEIGEVDITITRNKGLMYGKFLVDDYPPYIESWLKWRPRSKVIMPAHEYNKDFKHPNVLRYDGSNLKEVETLLIELYNR
jgi:hypothetical protein